MNRNLAHILIAIAAGEDDKPPEWIHLLPAGKFNGHAANAVKGPWLAKDSAGIIATSMAGERPLVVDFDHQTDFSARPGVGGQAPAAGWITEMHVRDDGIWGKVEWTPDGERAVAGKSYRFISPVFTFNSDGHVLQIVRAALTNNPALELTAVASKGEQHSMDETLKAILAALGLPEDATAEAATTAIGMLKDTDTGAAKQALAAALGLDEAAGEAAILAKTVEIAAAVKADPDPARFVPIETHKALATRVSELETAATTSAATAVVEAAVEAGKVIPAQRDWAMAFAAKDPAGFEEFAKLQPTILKPGQALSAAPDSKAVANGLDADETAVASALGLTAAQFKAARDDEPIENKEAGK